MGVTDRTVELYNVKSEKLCKALFLFWKCLIVTNNFWDYKTKLQFYNTENAINRNNIHIIKRHWHDKSFLGCVTQMQIRRLHYKISQFLILIISQITKND